jgi:sulfite exporter TauE/SafE
LDLISVDWQTIMTFPKPVIPGMVLLASLTGSLHCVGMCGPLVIIAEGDAKRWPSAAIYHTARLGSYVALGAISGALGGWLFGPDRILLSWVASITMAIVFLHLAWKLFRGETPHLPLPSFAMQWLQKTWGRSIKTRHVPYLKPFLMGLLTPLLPCGWLYAFVIGAVATESAGFGMMLMSFFWLGTLPALLGLSILLRKPRQWIRPQYRWVAASALLLAGCYTLASKILSSSCH